MLITPKERFLKAIKLVKVDRPPITCANQTATYEQMENIGIFWPEAHRDSAKMAKLAAAAWEQTGLEGVGVPFCQTVEAEILGCEIEWREKDIPSVPFKGYKSPDDVKIPENILEKGRIPLVLKALEFLEEKYRGELPIMGRVNGPFSLSAHLVDLTKMMVMTIRNPDTVNDFCELVLDIIVEYANAMYDHGADIVVIEDMVASAEILGPQLYSKLAAPFDKRLIGKLKGLNILHICGDVSSVVDNLIDTGANCISIDHKTDAREAVLKCKKRVSVMGNIDPVESIMLGSPEKVAKDTIEALKAGVNLIAPGCSLSPLSKNENIIAMVDAVKKIT